MQKAKVTIKFSSLTNLWSFRMVIEANIFEMNMSQISITCECTKEQVQLAIENYNGQLVETKEKAI
jgi:hypothetical protein